jgi:hypothetical protein
MTEEQEERIVSAFEQIATALTGIYDTKEKQFAKQWPERKEAREAVYSRVPNEEDLIREQLGASNEPLEEWLTVPEEEGYIGEREKEFLAKQAAATASTQETSSEDQQGRGSIETPEDQAGDGGIFSSDHTAV